MRLGQAVFLPSLCALSACAGAPTREPASLVELRGRGTVLQRHEYSCGAAALATLMGFFARPLGESEVLHLIFGETLPVEKAPDGREVLRALTLADLEVGARKEGFKVVSVQVPEAKGLEEALHSLKPAIARMSLYGEYLHFVVVRDIRGDWVSVSDPGYGSFRMPKSQFFASWDRGDRILLAIGREPFEAWKTREDRIFLRRSEADRPELGEDLDLLPVYRAVHDRSARLGSLP